MTKYAKDTSIVGSSSGRVVLKRNTAVDDSHPLVQERPELFADEPQRVAGGPKIERATRRPGERRGRTPSGGSGAGASKPSGSKSGGKSSGGSDGGSKTSKGDEGSK